MTIKVTQITFIGASINGGVLKDLDINSPAVSIAPICQVAYTPEVCMKDESTDDGLDALEDVYHEDYLDIPVYTSVQRESLICSLPIACPREERDAWLRRGVILYLRS